MNYQQTLDDIYRTFMAVKDSVKGRPDREVRQPERLISLAGKLGILPDAARTIRITGSKGKGTTSRLIARYLEASMPDRRIALFVSPEEFEHTDRMSMNGKVIEQEDFARIYTELQPQLRKIESHLNAQEYLSPFGLFLLIALYGSKRRLRNFLSWRPAGVRFTTKSDNSHRKWAL